MAENIDLNMYFEVKKDLDDDNAKMCDVSVKLLHPVEPILREFVVHYTSLVIRNNEKGIYREKMEGKKLTEYIKEIIHELVYEPTQENLFVDTITITDREKDNKDTKKR